MGCSLVGCGLVGCGLAGCASVVDEENGELEAALAVDAGEPCAPHWQRQLGSAEQSISSSGVASDAAGNAFVTGYTLGELARGPGEAAASDAFVAKYSATGELLWTRVLGTPDSDGATGVSTDGDGNVVISGDTFGALDGAARGFGDAFVAKYSASGELQWTRQWGTAAPDAASGVSVDVEGNVFLAGDTRGSLDGTRQGTDVDVWVSKYSAAGEWLWTRQWGSGVGDDELAAGVNANAGVVNVVGHSFGALEGDNRGSADAFVAQLSADGDLLWMRQLGGAGYDAADAVSADISGDVYISGQTGGVLAGGPRVVLPGIPYVAKYSPAGELLWELKLEDAKMGSASCVTTDAEGNAFLGGYTSGAWGAANQGIYDSFVGELSADGAVLWSLQFGVAELDQATGISADGTGHLFVSRNVRGLGADGSDSSFLTRHAVGSSAL